MKFAVSASLVLCLIVRCEARTPQPWDSPFAADTASISSAAAEGRQAWQDLEKIATARINQKAVTNVKLASDQKLLADDPGGFGGLSSGLDPYAKSIGQFALGHTDEARDSLHLALKDDDFAKLDARAWVIQGLLAMKYELAEDAKSAWQEAIASSSKDDVAKWSLLLIPK